MTFFEREFLHLTIILVPLGVLPFLGLRHHQEVLAGLGSGPALALNIGPAGIIVSTLQQTTTYCPPEGLGEVKLDDQVAGPDIQPLLHHSGGDQSVDSPVFELGQGLSQLPSVVVDLLSFLRISNVEVRARREGKVCDNPTQ